MTIHNLISSLRSKESVMSIVAAAWNLYPDKDYDEDLSRDEYSNLVEYASEIYLPGRKNIH